MSPKQKEAQVEETEEDDNIDKSIPELDVLTKEDFKGLVGFPKDSLLYQTSWIRLFLIIGTLGLWALKAERWKQDEIDKLLENADKTLSDQGLEDKNYHLCSDSKNNLLAIPDQNKLLLLKISVEEKDVIPYKKIDFKDIREEQTHQTYKLTSKESNQTVKLFFHLSDHKEKFLNDLEDEFNENGLYRYRKIWDDKETIEEMKRADIGLSNNFRNLTPYEFEEFVAKLFKKKGYQAYVTSGSADFGVDVIAEKNEERLAIQVKRYKESNKIGSPTIRKTLGSRYKADADKTLIVTTSYYTKPAFEQAENAPITLWDKKVLHAEVEKNFINLD